mmetsp:Transcript_31185/g.90029  ORF Transcript_31185/g.90029 Transcript_31185/m.90029 type:complete len:280 (+) Transcript_31185:399-1238(+)
MTSASLLACSSLPRLASWNACTMEAAEFSTARILESKDRTWPMTSTLRPSTASNNWFKCSPPEGLAFLPASPPSPKVAVLVPAGSVAVLMPLSLLPLRESGLPLMEYVSAAEKTELRAVLCRGLPLPPPPGYFFTTACLALFRGEPGRLVECIPRALASKSWSSATSEAIWFKTRHAMSKRLASMKTSFAPAVPFMCDKPSKNSPIVSMPSPSSSRSNNILQSSGLKFSNRKWVATSGFSKASVNSCQQTNPSLSSSIISNNFRIFRIPALSSMSFIIN